MTGIEGLAAALFGGLLTSASPCTLAAVPVAVGYVGGQAASPRRAWALSLGFVAGMNLALLALGLAAARLGLLLGALKDERARLADQHGRRVPLALKIAPDLDATQIAAIADLLVEHGIDAVIATNTTLARDAVAHLPHGAEAGGLSGAPLTTQAQAVTTQLAAKLAGEVPIIGVGGIMNGADAAARIAAGASLVQVYTGLVYAGPALVGACVDAIREV